MAKFVVRASPFGAAIEVNGEDVSAQVGMAQVQVANGQPTTLTLHLIGEGSIEGEGIVHIIDPAQSDADVICNFLAGLDPEQLDNDALTDADASTNLTAALLATLQRYARGDT